MFNVDSVAEEAIVVKKCKRKYTKRRTCVTINSRQFASLRNLGSTCYINCIIQVMRYSPGFTLSIHRLVEQIDYLKSLNIDLETQINNNSDSVFVKHLHELLNEMSDRERLDKRRPVHSPRKFVNTVWRSLSFWSNGTQQDAHEFLQYTIHFINECDLYLKKLHEQYGLVDVEKQQKEQTVSAAACDSRRKRKRSALPSMTFQYKSIKTARLKLNSTIAEASSFTRIATKGGASLRNAFSYVSNTNTNICDSTAGIDSKTPVLYEFQKPKRTRTTSSSQEQQQTRITESIDDIAPLLANECQSSTRSRTRTLSESTSTTTASSATVIPNPADILRKYSSISGDVCEMDKLFKGSSSTFTQCMGCENLRKSPEAFYDRSLPVNTIKNESMDLEWITKCLSNESYLDEDSKYMCDVCASKQEAKIYTQYTEMPNILVLHLLPYGITSNIDGNGNLNTQKLSNRSKLVTCFDCICEACLRQQDSIVNTIKHVFKLYAVVMHSGMSLNSGHYTTFINYDKNSGTLDDNPEWLHFDDANVKLLTNNEFQSKILMDSNYDSPYILFYAKDEISLI